MFKLLEAVYFSNGIIKWLSFLLISIVLSIVLTNSRSGANEP